MAYEGGHMTDGQVARFLANAMTKAEFAKAWEHLGDGCLRCNEEYLRQLKEAHPQGDLPLNKPSEDEVQDLPLNPNGEDLKRRDDVVYDDDPLIDHGTPVVDDDEDEFEFN